jgi:hypothetical protein
MKNGYYKYEDGEYWYLNGKWHREDGPAVIYSDGHQEWWVNGKCHREDGPAVIGSNGYQEWWVNGKCHREDGPARIWVDGRQEWWVNREPITNEVNKWFNDYNLTYETMDEEEKWCLIFYIRSLM